MKLLEQVEEAKFTPNEDFLDTKHTVSHQFNISNVDYTDTIEDSHEILIPHTKESFGYYLMNKITWIINNIKQLYTKVKMALGPFSLHKSILEREYSLKQDQPSLDSTTKIQNSQPTEQTPQAHTTETTQEQHENQNTSTNFEAEKVFVPSQSENKPNISAFKNIHIVETVFSTLEPLKDIFDHYSAALNAYSESLYSKKPSKIAQYTKIVDAYSASSNAIKEKLESIIQLRKQLQSDSIAQPSISKINTLEAFNVSELLQHAIMVIPQQTEELEESADNAVFEAKMVFAHFDLKTLQKIHTELVRKVQWFFDYPKTRKLTIDSTQPLEVIPGTTDISFGTIKNYLNLELQATLSDDQKSYDLYMQGREILWNWNKHYQIEDIENTKIILDYGLLYMKIVTTFNNRFNSVLTQGIKNIKTLQKLDRKSKTSDKR